MSRVQNFCLLLFSALLISWIVSSLLSVWNFHFQVFSHKFWFWSYFSQLQPPKHSDSIPQILKSFHKLLLYIHSLRNRCFLQTRHLKFTSVKSLKTLDNICYWFMTGQRSKSKDEEKKREEKISVDQGAFAGRLTQSPTESHRPSPEARSPKLRPGNIPRARDGTKSHPLSSTRWNWPKKLLQPRLWEKCTSSGFTLIQVSGTDGQVSKYDPFVLAKWYFHCKRQFKSVIDKLAKLWKNSISCIGLFF